MEQLWILEIWLYILQPAANALHFTQISNFFKKIISKEVLRFRLSKASWKKTVNVCLFFLDCFGINIFLYQTVTESPIYIEKRGWETRASSDIRLLLFCQLFLISCLSCHQWEQSCWGSSPMPCWETVWLLNIWYCISFLQCKYLHMCWEFMYLSFKINLLLWGSSPVCK